MKIVYNSCYGGFGLSQVALKWMADRGHTEAAKDIGVKYGCGNYIARDDLLLVECVETLGSKVASGDCAHLSIQEIPDGAQWEIDEYDGSESVVPPRQSW